MALQILSYFEDFSTFKKLLFGTDVQEHTNNAEHSIKW